MLVTMLQNASKIMMRLSLQSRLLKAIDGKIVDVEDKNKTILESQQLASKNVVIDKGKSIIENQELFTNLLKKDNYSYHYFPNSSFQNSPTCIEISHDLFKKHDDQLGSMLQSNSGASSAHVEDQNLTNYQVVHLMFTNVDLTKVILKDLIPFHNPKKK